MKKRFVMLLTACLALTLFAGCGEKEENSDVNTTDVPNVTLKDFNADELVTLGQYTGFEVVVAEPTVDEATQQAYVENVFQSSITEAVGVTDRAVENGDLAYISYVGKKDDVAFDGGTSEGTFLEIGSGSYIDGFEEGLVGVMPGETVDLNLTFPDPYTPNPDLSGAPVVFTVTVHYLAPEISDEVIAALGVEDFSNVEELNTYVYDNLLLQAEANYEIQVENAVIEQLIANTTFNEVPEDLVAKYTQNVYNNMEMAATQYGLDIDTYTLMYYGVDAATLTAQFGEDSAKQGLVFQAIANKENLNVSDEELNTELEAKAVEYGAASVDELIGDTDKEDYRDFFMFEKVIAFLVENTTVSAE